MGCFWVPPQPHYPSDTCHVPGRNRANLITDVITGCALRAIRAPTRVEVAAEEVAHLSQASFSRDRIIDIRTDQNPDPLRRLTESCPNLTTPANDNIGLGQYTCQHSTSSSPPQTPFPSTCKTSRVHRFTNLSLYPPLPRLSHTILSRHPQSTSQCPLLCDFASLASCFTHRQSNFTTVCSPNEDASNLW